MGICIKIDNDLLTEISTRNLTYLPRFLLCKDGVGIYFRRCNISQKFELTTNTSFKAIATLLFPSGPRH